MREVLESSSLTDVQRGSTTAHAPLASFLRFIGSCLLVAGAIAYLLEGWQSVGHISRYFKFLGVTGLLAGAGVATGIGLKENKGARTFLALALAAIPVNFCQLGALLYSVTDAGAAPQKIQSFLVWEAPHLGAALLTCLVGVVALAGVAWLSFSVLGRQGRQLLVPATFFVNSLLLVPLRSVEAACVLAIISFAVAGVVSYRLRLMGAFSTTFEAALCRLTLWVPGAIVLLRTGLLYEYSHMVTGILFLFSGGAQVLAAKGFEKSDGIGDFLEFIGGCFMSIAFLIVLDVLLDAFGVVSHREQAPYVAMALVGMSYTFESVLERSATLLSAIVSIAACVLAIQYGTSYSRAMAVILPLLVGGVVYGQGLHSRSVFVSWLGVLTVVIGMADISADFFRMLFDSWLGVSLVGVGAVLLASFVEKGSLTTIGSKTLGKVGLSSMKSK